MTPTEARKAVPRLHLQLAEIVKADQEQEIVRELPDELVDAAPTDRGPRSPAWPILNAK